MMGGQFGRPQNDPLYTRIIDYVWFTRVLIESGYRYYEVKWESGQSDSVWMKPGWGESFERDGGVVSPLPMRGIKVDPNPIILIDLLDGGYINEGGYIEGITKAA